MQRLQFLFILLLICCLTACFRPSINTPNAAPEAISAATVTPPPGKTGDDINIDWETIEWTKSMAASHPGGMSVGVSAAYKNSYPAWRSTFYAASDDEFRANIFILNGDQQPRQIALICLLDHLQLPCTPDDSLEMVVELAANEYQLLPVTLRELTPGFHDFDVLAIRDPYVDIQADNLESRETTLDIYNYNNLLVDGLTDTPLVEAVVLETKQRSEFDGLFYLSPTPDLVNDMGLIPYWLEWEGQAGELFDFYLHFSGPFDQDGEIISLKAFINYTQIPLYHEGEAQLPLYVQRKASHWQLLPVQIKLPEEPGVYEFYMAGRAATFQPLEWERSGNRSVAVEGSKRIRVIVR
jgi:hypothetical protein